MITHNDIAQDMQKKSIEIFQKIKKANTQEEKNQLYAELKKYRQQKKDTLIKTTLDKQNIAKMTKYEPNLKRRVPRSKHKIDTYNIYQLRCYMIENGDYLCKFVASLSYVTREELIKVIMMYIPNAIELFNNNA